MGVAVADKPDGRFARLCEDPILRFEDEAIHVEDPFLWYDEQRNKFCLLAKDDSKGGKGITGEWGAGFYAESDDCIRFTVADEPLAYSRKVRFGGELREQCNLEPGLRCFSAEESRNTCSTLRATAMLRMPSAEEHISSCKS